MATMNHDRPAATPYRELKPETVLDALDSVGLRGDGRLIQLNSYENRVFQVYLEDGRVVVTKFYRPGRWLDEQILEEHAFAAELAEQEIPVAACWPLGLDRESAHSASVTLTGPTLAQYTTQGCDYRFSVTSKLAGRAPELEDADTLEWLGRFIGRLHAVGTRAPFRTRLRLDVPTFGTQPREWLIDHELVTPDVATEWFDLSQRALDQVEAAFDRIPTMCTLRLHGDCHLGNVLWTSSGPHFVDLDDTVTGPAMQDLWMMLSGDRAAQTRQLAALLEGYETFMNFDARELSLIEPLRTLRIIHHSAWIARRWSDPAFPPAFPWFASPSYWAEQTSRLREQLNAMAEAPLNVSAG